MGDNYHAGFIFGQAISTVGILLFFVYAWSMQSRPNRARAVAEQAVETIVGEEGVLNIA